MSNEYYKLKRKSGADAIRGGINTARAIIDRYDTQDELTSEEEQKLLSSLDQMIAGCKALLL